MATKKRREAAFDVPGYAAYILPSLAQMVIVELPLQYQLSGETGLRP
jgi:hypothetical protein